jgi:methylglutaconyl-CoA hydratase
MLAYTTINVAHSGKVATVTLSRPEVGNAFNEAMTAELTDTFTELGAHNNVRAIVLEGAGKFFCAGADLNHMQRAANQSYEDNINAALTMQTMFRTIDRCPKPVIGKVHGFVLGGGFGLCAVCDIVIADADTKFALSEIRLGILPAVIGPFTCAKIGYSNFRAYGITGERFDAHTALRIGLIHDVVPAERLADAVAKKLEAIGLSGPEAIAKLKNYSQHLAGLDNDELRLLTAELISGARKSAEGKEGIGSFLEKRPAAWVDKLP